MGAVRYRIFRPWRDEIGRSHDCHGALDRRSKEVGDPIVLPTGASDMVDEEALGTRLTSPSSEQVRKRCGELSVTMRLARSAWLR